VSDSNVIKLAHPGAFTDSLTENPAQRRGCATAKLPRGRIRYSPSILPRYARRSHSLEVLIPIPYLKGISTGRFFCRTVARSTA
jgi:hypothetical protein